MRLLIWLPSSLFFKSKILAEKPCFASQRISLAARFVSNFLLMKRLFIPYFAAAAPVFCFRKIWIPCFQIKD